MKQQKLFFRSFLTLILLSFITSTLTGVLFAIFNRHLLIENYRIGFALSLLVSVFIVFIIMSIFIAFLLRKSLHPISEMSKIAIKIGEGDFSVKANESYPGELGQLGKSFNFLSKELSQTISELTLERNRLRQILYSLSEGIIAVDSKGQITHMNSAIEKLFPQTSKELEYSVSDDDRLKMIPYPSVWSNFDIVAQSSQMTIQNLKLENNITIRVIISPLFDEENKVAGAVGLFQDITAQIRLDQSRRDYVSNVSHELRTPLTAIQGLIEPLKDGLVQNDSDRLRYYDIILSETLRLSRLINDLMTLSRLQSEKLVKKKESFDLNLLLGDIVEKYKGIAKDKEINLTFESNKIPLAYSIIDSIEQVVVILLDNAIKFTDAGGEIKIFTDLQRGRIKVCVKDTGRGISQTDLPYIFERFYKADKSRNSSGTGIGLSIVKTILKNINEKIEVESTFGEGSVFTFTVLQSVKP
ncbi:MAG: ATP-binding protein [Candidatus Pacebacteria bacterium]|nr:ATP-binding protein [Candidatus Paceibacterota bacterium]